jgi:hypothetical protein
MWAMKIFEPRILHRTHDIFILVDGHELEMTLRCTDQDHNTPINVKITCKAVII